MKKEQEMVKYNYARHYHDSRRQEFLLPIWKKNLGYRFFHRTYSILLHQSLV